MGFPDRWCLWIKGVLISARSSVLVNGSPAFEFQCSKSIRQCDPLSPFLFLVVTEALSCMMKKAGELGTIDGIRIPHGEVVITNLLYADDAMVMGEWSQRNINNVARILRCFRLCSGLKINFHKSKLYGCEVSNLEISRMAEVLGCKAFVFLGIKVGSQHE
ncbi:putative mitochondrial protein AtMg01250 [Bidens hawaiensis]|uniref:putative mitochondrial protein AtMg01250 n=1 Tax=Bidens hawaiensis TaxID=980011 RepID=UPI004048FB08